MKIEVYRAPEPGEPSTKGTHSLWYGKAGVGKTATLLQTAEDPIFYLMAEGRSIDSTLRAINRPDLRLKVGYYRGFEDLLETLFELKNFHKVKTFVGDSMTHIMNVHLADEILAENFEAREQKKNAKGEFIETTKDLTTRVKGTPEMYGALSKQMSRLMTACQNMCLEGIHVAWIARDMDNPKWNLSLACGPAVAGKEFPRDMKGFFDFIGLVVTRFEGTEVVYPPLVSCDDNGSYLSKWTGVKPEGGVINRPFNLAKIIAGAQGVKI